LSTENRSGFHSAFAARGAFDLIVANIPARLLMRLAPEMKIYLAGGSLILSGILDRQRDRHCVLCRAEFRCSRWSGGLGNAAPQELKQFGCSAGLL
jgi:ribosomal protein L11 methylase PrmA